MTPTALQLLRVLGSGVSLPSIGRDAGAGGVSFEDMLSRAQRGEAVGAPTPVAVDPASGVSLSSAELEAVARGADRAEAAGVDRAVVLIDGRAVVVDVESRMVLSEVRASGQDALVGIEGVFAEAVEEDGSLPPRASGSGDVDAGSGDALPPAVSGGDPRGRIENEAVRGLIG